MNTHHGVLLAAVLVWNAAPAFAAGRCASGQEPRLSGDFFSPVECSSSTKSVPFLPDLPVKPSTEAKTVLKELEGRWEGSLVHALGRYTVLLTVKNSWRGKCEVTLELKEMQFHDHLSDRLTLAPGKPQGAYSAELSTSMLPDATLAGEVSVGYAAEPEASTPTAKVPRQRQVDLRLSNGAAHRVFFRLDGKDTLELRAFSGVAGAPLQRFETTLRRTKRETL